MAVAARANGLHHAVSLGTIEVSSQQSACSGNYDRSYDSEDENMSRRRLRHTSSTELYPRTSIYSKGDIREQYCLTDRQLNSIERPRRERLFGCLSRRSTPQSFLGVCVGRRVPSDENLAAYAPFYKYPRYPAQQHAHDEQAPDVDLDNGYFRRQPASILSTAKLPDTHVAAAAGNRYSWVGPTTANNTNEHLLDYANGKSSYHCPAAQAGVPVAAASALPMQAGPATPRTKHVSFARSHTLTSFDDVNMGLRSSARLKTARSQERLIGGKKPVLPAGVYEAATQMPPNVTAQQPFVGIAPLNPLTPLTMHPHQAVIHQHPHMHPHPHQHGHGHSHQHLHGPIHIHQFVPSFNAELATQVQTEQPVSLLSSNALLDELPGVGMGMLVCPTQTLAPPSPEVVVLEKKFRNAMKTQATQTEARKEGYTQVLALSPRTIHKVKVVSQGAQTNGMQSGKKLTKSLSEMPNAEAVAPDMRCCEGKEQRELPEHDALHRTQSEEPPRSPLESLQMCLDVQHNIKYYEPPPPVEAAASSSALGFSNRRTSRFVAEAEASSHFYQHSSVPDMAMEFPQRFEQPPELVESYTACSFDYESNSLPRRACNYHRTENEFHSNSLPRRDLLHSHDICKHITECSELMSDSAAMDFTRPHLLPPPQQYCRDDDEPETPSLPTQDEQLKELIDTNRRLSMVISMAPDHDTPFRRDDLRRQSMPVYVKTEKLIDGYASRASFRAKGKPVRPLTRDFSEEKEIFIDFKPRISPKPSPKTRQKPQQIYVTVPSDELPPAQQQEVDDEEECDSCESVDEAADSAEGSVDDNEDDYEAEDPVYENVPVCLNNLSDSRSAEVNRKEQFRKRSVSLDDAVDEKIEQPKDISAPPSPCQIELLANVSTYPSSDSLANDVTRDHSDGIWNESQVTVLTAEQRDISDVSSFSSNMLLTPSTKRKNLILQHQQRSSIDTDALELEEQLTDHSPTYSNVSMVKPFKLPLPQLPTREHKTALAASPKMLPPSIAVTPSQGDSMELEFTSPKKSPSVSRRSSKTYNAAASEQLKSVDTSTALGRTEAAKFNVNNDISECSTNTDEYATCTDNSKRTPGMKTPPTTTSSSSTTQVPVSTQSSQMDKTHGGSSFESASSLYSTRGEVLCEDALQLEEKALRKQFDMVDMKLTSQAASAEMIKMSPSHSISSTSSGSYNIAGLAATSPMKDVDKAAAQSPSMSTTSPVATLQQRDKSKMKLESVSDDERSDMRYSSSGYYESPQDDDQVTKFRRHRIDEDRKRRKTCMKLDIEKENMRALTSPIKKPAATATNICKERSPEKVATLTAADISSPTKIKRFRPKIRRQFRKTSRDDSSTPRRQRNLVNLYGLTAAGSTEKLLDCSIAPKAEARAEVVSVEAKPKLVSSPGNAKSVSEVSTCQLKAKSVESLRSVSPGSDSVFYSEADATGGDQQAHCLHCGKEMEGQSSIISMAGGDSVESLPYIDHENEQDIVKPPSDFADSPVTTKTTQRLYKKMDKRFRSEERYHGERGRLYKSRQENIRAKSEERSRDTSTRSSHALRPAGSSPCVLPDASSEQAQHIIYRGHYDAGRYTRLTDADVWTQLDHQSFDRHRHRRDSTDSERSFHSKYQVILHRLVQRRCTLEMYHRQNSNTFQLIASNASPDSVRRKLQDILKLMLLVWAREGYVLSKITAGKYGVDKTIVVKSDSGEFGFRIHGSKPVVVAAIEPETPAESSGLEVGDIIIAVNGVQVLDKHHTEVVKIAHDGCETLELQVARTIGVLMHEQQEPQSQPLYSGYLWRQSGQAKGAPNAKKWVRRWFSLRPDNCLYYYKTEEDTQPVGAMIMAKHTIEHCPPDIGKPFAFKVDCGEGIPLYVAADSEELTNRWVTVLRQSAAQEGSWLDKCARNLYQQPSSITKPDCFGYLLKLGSRWCGWSKRYCVLKDACLYFYQDANSKSAFGMACMHGYKVASMSTSASGKKNSFEIIPPETKLRHYYFCTDSEMDKKRWISALEYSIDRWIKSG